MDRENNIERKVHVDKLSRIENNCFSERGSLNGFENVFVKYMSEIEHMELYTLWHQYDSPTFHH